MGPQANCSIPQVPTPRNRHTLSVINNGTTLVACGQVRSSTSSCVSWQAGKGGWKDYATLSGKRLRGYVHAAVVLPNDTIIVVGSNEREQTGEIVGSEPRGDHACASFTSSNGEKGFLVAGG